MPSLASLSAFFWLAQAALHEKPTPGFLENNGEPIQVKFECTEQDIQAFGLDCSADLPCPVYLELNSVETAGSKLFLTGSFHTESATLYSVFLESTDEAHSFAEPEGRMRETTLDQAQFVDLQTGWIAGWTAAAVPRDPFFFVTRDGGKSWKKQFLFEEGKPGAIEQFHFDSADNGSILVDAGSGMRHRVFETADGGANWALRQQSATPIPLPVSAARRPERDEDKAWRIRADAKTKTYVLERQQDERWRPVARFFVLAGECKG